MKITRNDSNNRLDDREPVKMIVNQGIPSGRDETFGMLNQKPIKPQNFKIAAFGSYGNSKTSVNSTQGRLNFSEIQEQDELDPESLAIQTHSTGNQYFPNQPKYSK